MISTFFQLRPKLSYDIFHHKGATQPVAPDMLFSCREGHKDRRGKMPLWVRKGYASIKAVNVLGIFPQLQTSWKISSGSVLWPWIGSSGIGLSSLVLTTFIHLSSMAPSTSSQTPGVYRSEPQGSRTGCRYRVHNGQFITRSNTTTDKHSHSHPRSIYKQHREIEPTCQDSCCEVKIPRTLLVCRPPAWMTEPFSTNPVQEHLDYSLATIQSMRTYYACLEVRNLSTLMSSRCTQYCVKHCKLVMSWFRVCIAS